MNYLNPQQIIQWENVFSNPSYNKAKTENMQAQAQWSEARAKEEPLRTQSMLGNNAYRNQRLKIMQQNANYKQGNLLLQNQKSGFLPVSGSQLGDHGRALDTKTRSAMVTGSAAYDQLIPVLNQIMSASSDLLKNAPNKYKKFTSSFNSVLTGKANPEQEKFLESTGISKDDITAASETIMSVSKFPRVQVAMQKMFDMLSPRVGDTSQSYQARISEAKARSALAHGQYQFMLKNGVPVDQTGTAIMNMSVAQSLQNDPSYQQAGGIGPIGASGMTTPSQVAPSGSADSSQSSDTALDAYAAYLKSKGG